jgi:hypothetical protein
MHAGRAALLDKLALAYYAYKQVLPQLRASAEPRDGGGGRACQELLLPQV